MPDSTVDFPIRIKPDVYSGRFWQVYFGFELVGCVEQGLPSGKFMAGYPGKYGYNWLCDDNNFHQFESFEGATFALLLKWTRIRRSHA